MNKKIKDFKTNIKKLILLTYRVRLNCLLRNALSSVDYSKLKLRTGFHIDCVNH